MPKQHNITITSADDAALAFDIEYSLKLDGFDFPSIICHVDLDGLTPIQLAQLTMGNGGVVSFQNELRSRTDGLDIARDRAANGHTWIAAEHIGRKPTTGKPSYGNARRQVNLLNSDDFVKLLMDNGVSEADARRMSANRDRKLAGVVVKKADKA